MDVERLCLPATAVEREHELAAQTLAKWVPLHELSQLADQLALLAEREVRLEALLQRAQLKLLQLRNRGRGKPLVAQLAKRWATPQRQPLAQKLRGSVGCTGSERLAPLLDQIT